MLTQNSHHFSKLWHILWSLTQSFNMFKKINETNLVNSTHNAFLPTIHVWTMYWWKLLKNQRAHLTVREVVSPQRAVPYTQCYTFYWTQSRLVLKRHSTSHSTCLWLTILGIWLFGMHRPLHYQIWSYLDYTTYTDRVATLGYLLHFIKHVKLSIGCVITYVFLHEFRTVKSKECSCLCSLQLVELKYIYSVPFRQLDTLILVITSSP
jgi:hypothetical protein